MVTPESLYQRYRQAVGGTNHDGTYTLPATLAELGGRQRLGWHAAADAANEATKGAGATIALDDETAAFVDDWAREKGSTRSDVCQAVFALGLGKAVERHTELAAQRRTMDAQLAFGRAIGLI